MCSYRETNLPFPRKLNYLCPLGLLQGGSWASDNNDCWEYCFGREDQVTEQLVAIVNEMGLDGVDLDYEYFYEDNQNGSGFSKGAEAQKFLKDVTVGLRNKLPAGSELTHAPMDSDIVPGRAYYDVLVEVGSNLDFLMPQYYNGVTRPVLDGIEGTVSGSISALSHYRTLVNNVFGGDATKMVFGFCISDCSGTGSNANGSQAAKVMNDLSVHYSCNGGAFFWVAVDDLNGGWSSTVSNEIEMNAGCSGESNPSQSPVQTSSTPMQPVSTPPPVDLSHPSPSPTTTAAPIADTPCDESTKMSVNVGYYQSWAVWRNGCHVVNPDDIDVIGMGYTHLIYSFASISSSLTIEPWNGVASEEIPRMLNMNALKQTYPNLRTLVGVGGWTHNNPGTQFCNRFSDVSASAENRRNFADSVLNFLRTVSKNMLYFWLLF